jgi:hypothetical protein
MQRDETTLLDVEEAARLVVSFVHDVSKAVFKRCPRFAHEDGASAAEVRRCPFIREWPATSRKKKAQAHRACVFYLMLRQIGSTTLSAGWMHRELDDYPTSFVGHPIASCKLRTHLAMLTTK